MEDQILLFQQCKERSSGNLAAEISELLGVNVDAAYRRIRGTTSLTFDEVKKICLKYNLSFDSIINYSGSLVPFKFNAMFQEKFHILDSLNNISTELKQRAMAPSSHLTLTAMDLPYFRQFGFRALSRFKLFFWQRSVLNIEEYRFKKFNHNEVIEAYEELTYEIYHDYHNVESVEIWAPESLDSTIRQLQYYKDSGLFENPDSFRAVCDDLYALLDKLEKEAELGKKVLETNDEILTSKLDMYQSDIFLSNNCIQANVMDKTYTYVSFNSFNSLMSFSPQFSEECNQWIEQIRLKSILLSEVSEKLRYQFFLGLRKKIERFMNEL